MSPDTTGSPGAPDDDAPLPRAARLRTWWASWRVALRLARRDTRRHRGRSTLIVVMVALPVIALVAGATLLATSDLDEREALPLTLGDAAASLFYRPGGGRVVQTPTGSLHAGGTTERPAMALPAAPGGVAGRLAALTGGRVTEVTNTYARVESAEGRHLVSYLGIDASSSPALPGRARLLSGRWPSGPGEVLVTDAGVRKGVPASGRLSLTFEGGDPEPRDVAVVGTAAGYMRGGSGVVPADVIGLPDEGAAPLTPGVEYLLDRDRPVLLEEVLRLNAYGIHVVSRAVVLDPPGEHELAAASGELVPPARQDVAWAGFAALGGVALMLLTSLLAGPAFAVSAARARRTLALAASNGADRAQLRRTVLGHALVLGVGATVAALAIGIAAAGAAVTVLRPAHPDSFPGPFDVPWLAVWVIVATAVASSLVSALLPARGLGRLDVVGVLRGQSTSPPLRRRLPVAGLAVAAVGAGTTLWAATADSPNTMAAGSVVLVLGALLTVPALLVWSARATTNAPAAVRMATRDAARQRSRATPTVAAIMAGGVVLSTILVLVASDTAVQERYYTPRVVAGQGEVSPDGVPSDRVVAAVTAAAPEVRATPVARVTSPDPGTHTAPQVVALRTGCSPDTWVAQTFADPADGSCVSLSGSPMGIGFGSMAVADAAYLADLLDLDRRARDALLGGAVVVVDGVGVPPRQTQVDGQGWTSTAATATVDVHDATVHFARFGVRLGNTGPQVVGEPELFSVDAVTLPRGRFAEAFPGDHAIGAVLTPETARRLGLPLELSGVALDAGERPITGEEEDAIVAALDAAARGAQVYVERGFRPDPAARNVVLGVIGVVAFIILVATLIATALSQAEAESTSATLAAVGATRGTRRRLAAAHACSLALLGAGLGVLVGLVPGVAVAWADTATAWQAVQAGVHDPVIVVPWLQLLAPVVVVPLVAAGLAWVSIRRAPKVTRRIT